MYMDKVEWKDIAEAFGATRQTVYRRANSLLHAAKMPRA